MWHLITVTTNYWKPVLCLKVIRKQKMQKEVKNKNRIHRFLDRYEFIRCINNFTIHIFFFLKWGSMEQSNLSMSTSLKTGLKLHSSWSKFGTGILCTKSKMCSILTLIFKVQETPTIYVLLSPAQVDKHYWGRTSGYASPWTVHHCHLL